MANSHILGKSGEQEAVKFLENKGFCVLETNWRFKKLEIDIIAKQNNQLVIIEVKARKTSVFGEPETFVTPNKQANLIRAASEYIQQSNFNGECRFDIVSVLQDNDKLFVKHIENAFYASII